MKDVLGELAAAHRELGKGSVPAGEAYTVVLRRRYDAEIDDVWDAVTNAERLRRWFLPVSGDLRLGGTFQLEGNAGGDPEQVAAAVEATTKFYVPDPA